MNTLCLVPMLSLKWGRKKNLSQSRSISFNGSL